MQLFTEQQRRALLANGERSNVGDEIDPKPVVKLYVPRTLAIWLLTEIDPNEPEMAFGLCDLGQQSPELGSVWLPELMGLLLPSGNSVQRDLSFRATKTLSAYAEEARALGFIKA